MIWFSADFHLDHANIIKFCNRPFRDIGEMNEEIIRRWNSRVGNNDTGYILGDFCLKNPAKYLKRLNGEIVVLFGSHDRETAFPIRIREISPLKDEYGSPRTIVMCHYAMRSWPKSHYASWHLFGHHHGNLESYGLSFDVGVDCWGFYPVSLDEVAKKMKGLHPIVDFRKKG